MSKSHFPGLTRVDHIGLTVPDLDAAVSFYKDTFGATELFRLGPFDAKDLPRMADGRDWTAAHVNVPGARLSLVMLQLCPNLRLELLRYELPADARTTPPRNCDVGAQHIALKVSNLEVAVEHLRSRGVRVLAGPIAVTEGPAAGLRVHYFLDPWGTQLELVEYKD
ncbi:MAG: VOC family protein [Hyalangium sp.]|uniref:VOC family protein n=1 Tax=Hyalangium sp. TaxID=2028555 RepID=UPI00389B13CB